MSKKELSREQIEDLIVKAKVDPHITKQWPDNVAIQVYAYMRKRGLLPENTTYGVISYINWKDELMQRFYLLAVNAYIGRSIKELELNESMPAEEIAVVKKFFNEKLCFNAYKHVEEGLEPGVTREEIVKSLGFQLNNGYPTGFSDSLTEEQRGVLSSARDSIRAARNAVKECQRVISNTSAHYDVLTRRLADIDAMNSKLSNLLGDNSERVLEMLNHIPPVDNIHYFNRFCSDNWSVLRELTSKTFNVPKDMELTLWFHGASNTESGARTLLKQIHNQCTFGAIIIGNKAPALIAPDLEPEEATVRFDASNDLINKIIDRAEKDQKIVEKITKKKIRSGRKKAILDEFKKDPNKREKTKTDRKQGVKTDVTGLREYARSVGKFRPGNDTTIDSDEEQEIVDEVLKETEEDNSGDNVCSVDAEDCKPIAVFGMNSEGKFDKVDVHFQIPDSMSFEALTDQHFSKK